ncbi:MAG TPA: hypothetical protein VGW38_18100 [Chloroflexota bacterium]|nr:hypothetical protein [Chloroflexota bacterium]
MSIERGDVTNPLLRGQVGDAERAQPPLAMLGDAVELAHHQLVGGTPAVASTVLAVAGGPGRRGIPCVCGV